MFTDRKIVILDRIESDNNNKKQNECKLLQFHYYCKKNEIESLFYHKIKSNYYLLCEYFPIFQLANQKQRSRNGHFSQMYSHFYFNFFRSSRRKFAEKNTFQFEIFDCFSRRKNWNFSEMARKKSLNKSKIIYRHIEKKRCMELQICLWVKFVSMNINYMKLSCEFCVCCCFTRAQFVCTPFFDWITPYRKSFYKWIDRCSSVFFFLHSFPLRWCAIRMMILWQRPANQLQSLIERWKPKETNEKLRKERKK